MGVAGTGEQLGPTTPKLRSQVLDYWETAISKTSFTKNEGELPLNRANCLVYLHCLLKIKTTIMFIC